MTIRYVAAVALGLLLGALTVRAQDYYSELRVAQEHLQASWNSLHAVPADPHGHRDQAMASVSKALHEIQLVLAGEPPRGHLEEKSERRQEKLERKNEKREQRLEEKSEKREERMEER